MTGAIPKQERRPATAKEVREWARKVGDPVGVRGHLPAAVIDRFNQYSRQTRFDNNNPFCKDES